MARMSRLKPNLESIDVYCLVSLSHCHVIIVILLWRVSGVTHSFILHETDESTVKPTFNTPCRLQCDCVSYILKGYQEERKQGPRGCCTKVGVLSITPLPGEHVELPGLLLIRYRCGTGGTTVVTVPGTGGRGNSVRLWSRWCIALHKLALGFFDKKVGIRKWRVDTVAICCIFA